jgi:hypothetical protein
MSAWLVAIALSLQTPADNQASAAFTVVDQALRHESGFLCPAAFGDIRLAGSRPGAPGDPGAPGAYCEYQEAGQTVAYLAFSPENGPALTDAACQRLPGALRLQAGPALPGVRRYEPVGPWPERAPPLTVQGKPMTPVTCTLARPPFTPAIIVYAAAAFSHAGWTIRAINTPVPPPCCAGYPGARPVIKDLLQMVLLHETARGYEPPLPAGLTPP